MSITIPLHPVTIASLEEGRMAHVMREVGTEFAAFGGYLCGFGGAGSWQNQTIVLPYEGEPDADAIEAADAFYVARGVEPQINVAPHVHPGLLERVTALGYRCKQVELVYAIDLEAAALEDVAMPDGVAFETVARNDPARIDDWARMNTLLFFGEGDHAVHVEAARRCALVDRATSLMVTSDGEDVGVGGFETFGELAALWGAAVREDHRRRGIQLALIHERLRLAREAGCRYATIGSVAGIGTERNAMRAGMRLVYPRLEMARAGEALTPSV